MDSIKLLKEQCEKYEITIKDMNNVIESLLTEKVFVYNLINRKI